jgi:predicted O-linked N-acetylglucosamine transferase (SPINDLY family)
VTFGCFNHASKLSEPAIALWSRLLAAHPTARLRLKSRGLDDPATADGLRAKFSAHGMAAGRILIDGRTLSTAGQLGLYNGIDVALDPFPYNGTTTTCEALWMGVPVVTLAGATHVARVGASLLTHVGAPEWVATTEDDYLGIAGALVADAERLAEIRAGLRERLRAGPLCDAERFTRALERACLAMAG